MHSYLHGHPALLYAVKRLEALKPDEFELYFEKHSSTRIESKDQKIDALSRAEDVGLSVRVIKDRRLGFSFTTSLEKAAIERACDTALEIALLMPQDEYVGFYPLGTAPYPNIENSDPNGPLKEMDSKIALAKTLEKICRSSDPRITGIRSAGIGESASEVHLVDSHGEHIQHSSTLYTASVTCKAEESGDSQVGADFAFSNFLEGLDIQTVGKQAAKWATELLGAGAAPTMTCPAVLRNSVVADLIDFLSASFSAEQMNKGRSMLAGKKGERVFSESIHLFDDGLLSGGYGTSPFDGEGIPCRKTTLVNGGFVSGALYDAYYARKAGTEATGNATRGIKSPPSIGTSNLYLQPGRKTHEQLIASISRGILITDLMGVHTANPVTGDFSLGASGILIESGKLTRPVRGFAVAGNILETLRRVTEIGADLRFFGGTGAPSVSISEISVGGA